MHGSEDIQREGQVDQHPFDSAIKLVASGMAARMAGAAFGVIGGFATTSLAVRLLGLESYGVLAFGLSMLTIVAALANSGLGLATVQKTAEIAGLGPGGMLARLVRGSLTAGILVGLAGGGILTAILYLWSEPIEAPGRAIFAIGLGLLLLGRSIATVALSVLRGLGRMWLTEIPNAVLLVGQLGVVSTAFLADQAHVAVVAGGYGGVGIIAAVVSVAIVGNKILGSEGPAWSLSAAKAIFVVAWPLAIVAVATQVLARLDVVILGFFWAADEVGGYEPTLKLVDRLMLLTPLLLMAAYLPASTRLYRANDLLAFRRLYRTTAKVGYIIGFPALLLLATFPQAALAFLYGADFPVLRHVVSILLIGYAVNLAFGLNGTALISTGRNRQIALIYLGVFAVVVVSALALIPATGSTGAAVSTALGYITLNGTLSMVLLRNTGVHLFGRDVVLTLATSVAALAAGLAVSMLWTVSSVFAAAVISVTLWGLWVSGLFATRALSKEEVKAFLVRDSSVSPVESNRSG